MKIDKISIAHELLGFEIEASQLAWFVPLTDIAQEIVLHQDRMAFVIEFAGERIGFFVGRRDRRDPRCWWLCYLMLDRRQQGRGYGKHALRLILAYLSKRPGCRRIRLQVTPGNAKARTIYQRAGFADTGLTACDGDDILELRLVDGDTKVWILGTVMTIPDVLIGGIRPLVGHRCGQGSVRASGAETGPPRRSGDAEIGH